MELSLEQRLAALEAEREVVNRKLNALLDLSLHQMDIILELCLPVEVDAQRDGLLSFASNIAKSANLN